MSFWKKAVLCVFSMELLGNASGLVTMAAVGDFYGALVRPPATAPDWVFGPAWLLLYAMMGIALALLWHQGSESEPKRRALTWFGLQFVLNLLWTPAFFGLQRIDLALLVIVPLLLAIGLTIRSAYRVNRPAAALLVPYILWVAYATYLNAGFLILNGAH